MGLFFFYVIWIGFGLGLSLLKLCLKIALGDVWGVVLDDVCERTRGGLYLRIRGGPRWGAGWDIAFGGFSAGLENRNPVRVTTRKWDRFHVIEHPMLIHLFLSGAHWSCFDICFPKWHILSNVGMSHRGCRKWYRKYCSPCIVWCVQM